MYAQKDYHDIQGRNGKYTIAEAGSFLTAFSNLLLRFGYKVDPAQLNESFKTRDVYLPTNPDEPEVKDGLGWGSITAYNGLIHVQEIAEPGGWPPSDNAIVKFFDKNQAHFCLMDTNHKIVDSWDGLAKDSPYGEPVAWATFENIYSQPVTPVRLIEPEAVKPKDPNTYIMQKGDSIYTVAQRYGYTSNELMEHNAITEAQARNSLQGVAIHLPVRRHDAQSKPPVYELFLAPRPMHIKNDGVNSWSFAGEFKPVTHYAKNTNVDILAMATVEDSVFYMDKIALGDFVTTGRVAYTIGYKIEDLEDGYVDKIVKEVPLPETAALPTTVIDLREPKPDWQASYRPFDEPVMFTAQKSIWIHDLAQIRPDRPLVSGKEYNLAGSFPGPDNVLYYRPVGAVNNGHWFGIPTDAVISNDELYNTDVDLPTRVAFRSRLTIQERVVVEPLSKVMAIGPRFKTKINKLKE